MRQRGSPPSRALAGVGSCRRQRSSRRSSSAASARACARPVSLSGGSAWPWKRLSRFQSVSPCRTRTIVVATADTVVRVDLGLSGKRCLVTGSTAGIGLEVVRQLASEGARVVSCGRRGAPGAGEVAHVIVDLARAGEPERAVEEAAATLGGLDVLVNNVGDRAACTLRGRPRRGVGRVLAAERHELRAGDSCSAPAPA